MTLSEFALAGSCLKVEVRGLSETLWFVSGPEQVEKLRLNGVHRGRIWTARELRDMLEAHGMTTQIAVTIARAKLNLSAKVVTCRPGSRSP